MRKQDEQNTSIIEYQRYRPLALAYEFVPLMIGIIGAIIGNNQLINLGFILSAFVYFLLCWFLFKAEDYNVFDALFAMLLGMGLSIVVLMIPYELKDMENRENLLLGGFFTILVGIGFTMLFLYLKKRSKVNWEFEYTMSLKILSRYIFFLLLYFFLGMHQPFMNWLSNS